jgi:hypothetical protein
MRCLNWIGIVPGNIFVIVMLLIGSVPYASAADLSIPTPTTNAGTYCIDFGLDRTSQPLGGEKLNFIKPVECNFLGEIFNTTDEPLYFDVTLQDSCPGDDSYLTCLGKNRGIVGFKIVPDGEKRSIGCVLYPGESVGIDCQGTSGEGCFVHSRVKRPKAL